MILLSFDCPQKVCVVSSEVYSNKHWATLSGISEHQQPFDSQVSKLILKYVVLRSEEVQYEIVSMIFVRFVVQ
jgi:hypothetical protein